MFSVLPEEDDANNKTTTETAPTAKVQKPPPIFVHWGEKIQPLIQILEISAANRYLLRVLYDKQVKVQPKSPENYSAIIKALRTK